MRTAFRGSVFHCVGDPGEQDREEAIVYFEDGVLVVMLAGIGEAVKDGTAESRAHVVRVPGGARFRPAYARHSSAARQPGR